MKIGHVIVVVIDRNRPPVPVLPRRIAGPIQRMRTVRVTVGFDVDAIMEICDNVARTVKPDRRVGSEDVSYYRPSFAINDR